MLGATSTGALLALGPLAIADTLDFTATDSVTLDGTTYTPTSTPPETGFGSAVGSQTSSGGSVNILDDGPAGANGTTYLTHVYGDQTGDFGSRASGQANANYGTTPPVPETAGSWNIQGDLTVTDTITNTTGSTANYELTFTIVGGDVNADTVGGGDNTSADLSVDINFNGTDVASANVTVASSNGTTTTDLATSTGNLMLGGAVLNGYYVSDGYEFPTETYNVLLGPLAAGQSGVLTYDLDTSALGSGATCTVTPHTGGGGITATSVVALTGDAWRPRWSAAQNVGAIFGTGGGTSYSTDCDSSIGRSGDPFDTTDANVTPLSTSAVPEPVSALLLGTGLVGLAALRRRKRRADADDETIW